MNIDKAKQALTSKLKRQKAVLQGSIDDAEFIRRPHCRDAGEIAEERERAVIIDNTLQEARKNIVMIEAALAKMLKDKSYGICDRCGDTISEQRLFTLPEAMFCLNCQKTIDTSTVMDTTQLWTLHKTLSPPYFCGIF